MVWAIFATLGPPRSYLGVSCGEGWDVRVARMAGCKPAIGTGTPTEKAHCSKWATMVVPPSAKLRSDFELASCFKVVPLTATELELLTLNSTRWVVTHAVNLQLMPSEWHLTGHMFDYKELRVWER